MSHRKDERITSTNVPAPHKIHFVVPPHGDFPAEIIQAPRPAQLPPDIEDFTGRAGELEKLKHLLDKNSTNESGTAVVISAIAGKAGVGKTALAVRVSHQLADKFSDGQLYVNLRGYDEQKLDAADVLDSFIRALGGEGVTVPRSLEDRVSMYRAQLADKKVLVVLDNASSEAQIRPLLPGNPKCTALITSRHRLNGLEAAHQFSLDVLDPDEAVNLLTNIAGHERVTAEPESADSLVRLCGYLPLAVRIVGARLAGRTHLRVSALVQILSDERQRLSELRAGDLEVRPSLALSYRACTAEQRRALRLIALMGAQDFPSWTVAALLGADVIEGRNIVEQLADANLLDFVREDELGEVRHRLHDLTRAFAQECLSADETSEQVRNALTRLHGSYMLLADHADRSIAVQRVHMVAQPDADPWVNAKVSYLQGLTQDSFNWFTVELPSLVAAIKQAHKHEMWPLVWVITDRIWYFCELRSHWTDWELCCRLALDSGCKAGNDTAEGYALIALGIVLKYQGQWADATSAFVKALEVFDGLGDKLGRGYGLYGLGIVGWYQGQWLRTLPYFEKAIEIFREFKDRRQEAYCLRSFGIFYRYVGKIDLARSSLHDALDIFTDLPDEGWVGYTLRSLGQVYTDNAEYDEAVSALQKCANIFNRLNYRHAEAAAIVNLGDVYLHLKKYSEAADCYRKGIGVFTALGDRRWQAYSRCGLGSVELSHHRSAEALAHFEYCIKTFRELGDQLWIAKALTNYGRVLLVSKELGRARGVLLEALSIFDELGASDGAEVRALLASTGSLEGSSGEAGSVSGPGAVS